MKKLFLFSLVATLVLIITIIFTTSCNNDSKTVSSDSTATSDSMNAGDEDKEERNKKAALASLEGINSHNVDMVLKDADPSVTDYNDGSMPPMTNLDTVKAGLTSWFAAFPDVKGENLRAVADGEWVMVWGDWSGTWRGDFMGQKATNRPYKVKDVDIFRFNEAGKIIEHHNVQSFASLSMQTGMKMP